MSLKGVRKALYRTPHMLFGSKTGDDAEVQAWEHDIDSAMAGLAFVELQAEQWRNHWKDTATLLVHTIGCYNDIHKPLEDEKERNSPMDSPQKSSSEQFSYITRHELGQAFKLARMLYDELTGAAEAEYSGVTARCTEMRKNLKAVHKLLVKRNHKKLDYDMDFTAMDSMLSAKGDVGDKEKAKIEHSQHKMTQSRQIFENLDKKVRLVLPPVLEVLSEFLNKLTLKIYFGNVALLKLMVVSLNRFALSQGLLGMGKQSYDSIVSDFNDSYAVTHGKLESLGLLTKYSGLQEKGAAGKVVDTAGHAAGNAAGFALNAAVNTSEAVYNKATKGQKVSIKTMQLENPVKPASSEGMFSTALDPLQYSVQEMYAKSGAEEEEGEDEDEDGQKSEPAEPSEAPKSPVTATSPSVSASTAADPAADPAAPPPPLPPRSATSPLQSPVQSAPNDWMRPLSLKKGLPLPATLEEKQSQALPTLPEKEQDPQATDARKASSSGSRKFSFNLTEGTETAKYTSVKISKIKKAIKQAIMQPPIESSPVTALAYSCSEQIDRYGSYAAANSSISAHLFKQSLQASEASS